jgi:CheY-like chemotaxis protein
VLNCRSAGNEEEMMTDAALRMQVLVVEDDRDITDVLTIVFNRLGHSCHTAGSGAAALAAARAVCPDVVFIDLSLPDMSGFELAGRLRADPSCEPLYLVAMTGFSSPEQRSLALGDAFDEYEVKPVEFEVLAEIVGRAQKRRDLAVR